MSDSASVSASLSSITANAKKIGRELVVHGFKLWFVIQSPSTPAKIKVPLIAALVYLGCPVDAVPDVLPIVGFSDDAAVVAGALAAAHLYITDDIAAQAHAQADAILG